MHFSSKRYGHEQGLSACFRQWRATSHCNRLHGYALSITLNFQAIDLDSRNWVVDFGGLKPLKERLVGLFDHTTLVAEDDPKLQDFIEADRNGIMDLRIVKAVGCEAFAKQIYFLTEEFLVGAYVPSLLAAKIKPPLQLAVASVEVREHGSNGAVYAPGDPRPLTNAMMF